MAHLGKALERLAREWRSYFLPSHWRTYRELSRRTYQAERDRPVLCLDFRSTRIDSVMGRYLYHLVRDFVALGYLPLYRANFRFLATMRHKKYKRLLLDLPFAVYDDDTELPADVVYVTDDPTLRMPDAGKHVLVSYEHRRPQADDELALPFFVHPQIDAGETVPDRISIDEPRPMRIFFAGATRRKRYGGPLMREAYGKLSRAEMLDIVDSTLGTDQKRTVTDSESLLPEPGARPTFTLVDTDQARIPPDRWMATLQQADFFLGCPGVEMPLCHNLIEALAAGSVPILQYGEYLDPPLEHGVNCLAFDSPGELIATLHWALSMPEKEIRRLRAETRVYYDSHLRPGRFAERVLDTPAAAVILYLNAYRVPIAAKA